MPLPQGFEDRILAILEMQEKSGGKPTSNPTDVNRFLNELYNSVSNIYNHMSDDEKEEYGSSWFVDAIKANTGISVDSYNNSTTIQLPRDPLVIDLGKKGVVLTDVDNGVHFDLDKNGFAEKTAWIGTEDGFLDRNNNQNVDDGGELFGDQMTLKNGMTAVSGFEALADLDSNGDGVIDENDEAFKELKVWTDANHNGKSKAGELKTLDELGIVSSSLDHNNKNETDLESGTIVSETSVVKFKDDTEREISEHWFQIHTNNTEDNNHLGDDLEISSVEAFGNIMNLNNAIAVDSTGELLNLVN